MFIISQIFGVLALVCIFISYQCHTKSKIIFWQIICNVFAVGMFVFIDDWLAVAMATIAFFRCIAYFFIEENRDTVSRGFSVSVLLFFLTAAAVSMYLTASEWLDFVLIPSSLFLSFASWVRGEHLVRFANIIWSVLFIVHNAMVSNFMGIAIEATVIISIFIFYIKRLRADSEEDEVLFKSTKNGRSIAISQ